MALRIPASALPLAVAEAAVICALSEADPLFRLDAPPLDDAAVVAVVDGLRARGVVVRETDGDQLAPRLLPLFGAMLRAPAAVAALSAGAEGPRELTILFAGEVAVSVFRGADDLLWFTPLPPAAALPLLLAEFDLPLDAQGAEVAPGEPVELEAYLELLDPEGEAPADTVGRAAIRRAIAAAAPVRHVEFRSAAGPVTTMTIYGQGDEHAVVEHGDGADVQLRVLDRASLASCIVARSSAFQAAVA